jgi:hypothetical protein
MVLLRFAYAGLKLRSSCPFAFAMENLSFHVIKSFFSVLALRLGSQLDVVVHTYNPPALGRLR